MAQLYKMVKVTDLDDANRELYFFGEPEDPKDDEYVMVMFTPDAFEVGCGDWLGQYDPVSEMFTLTWNSYVPCSCPVYSKKMTMEEVEIFCTVLDNDEYDPTKNGWKAF